MTARTLPRIPIRTLAAFGAVVLILLGVGLALDVRNFDPTSGGYEPPYRDFTGTPIDWSQADQTRVGMASRGYVVNVLVDCTSGMISLETFKQVIPFRPFSPRALAVHQPRDACTERGFEPEF